MKELRATEKNPHHVSCGGVIINNQGQLLLLHRIKSKSWAYDSWHLPKGTKLVGETNRQTAERECLEETGWQIKIVRKIGFLESTYQLNSGRLAQKVTHYYLCKPVKHAGTATTEHDEQKWVSLNKAIRLLSQFKLWEKEEKIVKKIMQKPDLFIKARDSGEKND